MRIIVSLGWTIYPAGYVLGTLTCGASSEACRLFLSLKRRSHQVSDWSPALTSRELGLDGREIETQKSPSVGLVTRSEGSWAGFIPSWNKLVLLYWQRSALNRLHAEGGFFEATVEFYIFWKTFAPTFLHFLCLRAILMVLAVWADFLKLKWCGHPRICAGDDFWRLCWL